MASFQTATRPMPRQATFANLMGKNTFAALRDHTEQVIEKTNVLLRRLTTDLDQKMLGTNYPAEELLAKSFQSKEQIRARSAPGQEGGRPTPPSRRSFK